MAEKIILYAIAASAIAVAIKYIYNIFKGKADNSCSGCTACSEKRCSTEDSGE